MDSWIAPLLKGSLVLAALFGYQRMFLSHLGSCSKMQCLLLHPLHLFFCFLISSSIQRGLIGGFIFYNHEARCCASSNCLNWPSENKAPGSLRWWKFSPRNISHGF